METTRQKKVARLVLKELSQIFNKETTNLIGPMMISITAVRISPDLSRNIRFSEKASSLVLPVACSRGSGMDRSAFMTEVTARPRLELVDTSLERFLAKRDIVGSAAV